ncbi:MAG TPA: phytanoyl-CoA dioxygenase [Actinobacteria bacterium]|nr:phytanoyl-CoA dioxygenase [Actinomycetota bacterium]
MSDTPGRPGLAVAAQLADLTDTRVDHDDYPAALEVRSEVLVYDAQRWAGVQGRERDALKAELARALDTGPGVVLLSGAFADTSVIDEATEVFADIIDQERASGAQAGDHFGRPGANSRIWNAQQKLALQAPQVFARYFSQDAIAVVSEAWLGPGYQMTSQVNVVHPGGAAQDPHCDYHLGFQSQEMVVRFPEHVQRMSPYLTLQGAVAHVDMPVESGPTMLLPHSQRLERAYQAYHVAEVRELFAERVVQLPLAKGDVLFFSPALLHAAGTNRSSDLDRMVNLLQVSSAFGRAMESVDRVAMCGALYPVLLESSERWPDWAIDNVVAACAEGYAFPTNLDQDQPIGGLAPESSAQILRRALGRRASTQEVMAELSLAQSRRLP